MKQLTLITYLFDRSAFDWGMELKEFKVPTIIVAHPSLKEEIENMDTGCCRIEYRPLGHDLSYYDSISLINWLNNSDPIPTASILFCEASLIYKQISFDQLYMGIMQRAILNKELVHHNLAESVRSQGLFFTLNMSLLTDLRASLHTQMNQIILGEDLMDVQPVFPMAEKLNEDVNLIVINEVVGKTLHLIGDSHSLLTLTPNKELGCRSHVLFDMKKYQPDSIFDYQFTHHIGSKTMHGFSHGDEFGKDFLEQQGVKLGDSVVFVFGEIDIRSHVYKHVSLEKTIDIVVEELINSYLDRIEELTAELKPNVIVMGAIPPMNGLNYVSEEYPIQGTLSQRVEATRIMNKLLLSKCKEKKILFFEVNDLYALTDGSLDMDQSDMFCHISHYHQEKAINRMLKTVSQ